MRFAFDLGQVNVNHWSSIVAKSNVSFVFPAQSQPSRAMISRSSGVPSGRANTASLYLPALRTTQPQMSSS